MPRANEAIVERLSEIEAESGVGELAFGRGKQLRVTSLDKVFFPRDGYTKGDLMRYYATVAPYLLPIVKDRPLVLKRYPDGIDAFSFFQQNAGTSVPPPVRTETLGSGKGKAERIVGGDLATLLYTVQIGTIAVHPWQSRTTTHQYADSSTIDLDPGDDVEFSDVVVLARLIKAELDKLSLKAAIKTSGASGLHIVLPLPAKTTYDVSSALAQTIAEHVADANPKRATTERTIRKRPAGTIYVDAQQNSEGKSVVAAYSVRERSGATVSAPIQWRELRSTLRLERFTIATMPARLQRMGDLWSVAMKARNTRRTIDRVLDGR